MAKGRGLLEDNIAAEVAFPIVEEDHEHFEFLRHEHRQVRLAVPIEIAHVAVHRTGMVY